MDQYIGGIEHAILHLLYARFWTKVMRDFGMVDYRRAVHAPADAGDGARTHAFCRRNDKGGVDYFSPARRRRSSQRPRARITGGRSKVDGAPVEYDGLGTMSKSQELNGVDPQDMIDRYGADTARLFVMFASAARAHDRMVRHRRRRRAPLPEAAVDFTRSPGATRCAMPPDARLARCAPTPSRRCAARSTWR